MTKHDIPVTQAIRLLRARNIPFTPYFYEYEEHGGTSLSASALGVPEHNVIKTIVLETTEKRPLIVLMHGDCEISTKTLARLLGVKGVSPCDPHAATKHTGYLVGGTSPLGTLKPIPVYAESSIFALETIYINGGKRGFLIGMHPSDMREALELTEVQVAIPKTS